MSEPLLVVDRVTRRFGGLLAVNAASLSAQQGRITALIGPNGAGKTTLFAMISGFIPASEGIIRFAGEDIGGEPPHRLARRGIARTFQIVQPFAGLSVCENILVGAHLHHRAREAALAAAEGVQISADRFDRLADYMDNIPPSTRSSLLIDLEMGKPIEVEALQGAAVRRAARHGLPLPIISTLYAVLRQHGRRTKN